MHKLTSQPHPQHVSSGSVRRSSTDNSEMTTAMSDHRVERGLRDTVGGVGGAAGGIDWLWFLHAAVSTDLYPDPPVLGYASARFYPTPGRGGLGGPRVRTAPGLQGTPQITFTQTNKEKLATDGEHVGVGIRENWRNKRIRFK